MVPWDLLMLCKIYFLNFDWRYRWFQFHNLFLILFLAWNQFPKIYQIKQKLCKGTKTCVCGTLWYWIVVFALYGFVWSCMDLWDLIRPRMVLMLFTVIIWLSLRDLLWTSMALYGLVWPFYSLLWSHMAIYGLFSRSYIDPNSFGLV